MQKNTNDFVKKAYLEYCKREFGSEITENMLGNVLELAYTNVGHERYDLQVSYDVIKENEIVSLYDTENDTYIEYQEPMALELFYNEIQGLDFGAYYSYAHDIVCRYFVGGNEIEF